MRISPWRHIQVIQFSRMWVHNTLPWIQCFPPSIISYEKLNVREKIDRQIDKCETNKACRKQGSGFSIILHLSVFQKYEQTKWYCDSKPPCLFPQFIPWFPSYIKHTALRVHWVDPILLMGMFRTSSLFLKVNNYWLPMKHYRNIHLLCARPYKPMASCSPEVLGCYGELEGKKIHSYLFAGRGKVTKIILFLQGLF